MKLFKKITGAVVAIALVLTTIFTVSAFNTKANKNATMYYYFNSDQEADITDLSKWIPIDAEDVPGASCDGEALSCVISFDTGDFDDLSELLTAYPSTDDLRNNQHVVAEKNPIAP